MKINPEDCEIIIKEGRTLMRHKPTNRCIFAVDDNASSAELFEQLQQDVDRLEAKGLLGNKDVVCIVHTNEEVVVH